MTYFPKVTLAALLLLLPLSLAAQDTTFRLDEVQVSGQRAPATLRTATPTQVLDAEQLEEQGAIQLSDAVKMMAGVTLKDYGGIGGIKTVSARGLGSQFSTLTIDGVAVDDAQNGQVDFGRYMLGNAAYVSLSHGNSNRQGLLSARACATGSVINMETAEPAFFMAERTNLKLGMEIGSYGTMSPALLWEQRWGKRLKMSLWANYLKSDGDYPFILNYTTTGDGQTSRERRLHSAMRMGTADAALFYTFSPESRLTAKLHYMRGQHQLPGPVQYYTQVISQEQTEEEVAFAQARWAYSKGPWQVQLLGKLQSLYDLWEDPDANTGSHYQYNTYLQREAYASAAAARKVGRMEASLAVDGSVSRLLNNKEYCNDVLRSNLMAVGQIRYTHGRLDARAHLLGTMVDDHVTGLANSPSYSRLSPYLGAFIDLGRGTTLRMFYKEVFRVPNFGELYFFPEDTVPHSLRPEKARQVNLGLTHARAWEAGSLSATADAYYNRVSDKIIAVPGRSMFLWTMINEGLVEIIGTDVTADMRHKSFSLQLNYTFQHAVVRTDPDDPKTYGCQIAYTPRHSGGMTARWENRWVNLGSTAMLVGHRFSSNQNALDTRLPAYLDLGLSADRSIDLRWGTMRLAVRVLNLLDTQYEVVKSYPMMGRNYRLSVIYEF